MRRTSALQVAIPDLLEPLEFRLERQPCSVCTTRGVTIARMVGTSNSTVDGVIYRLRQSPCQDGKS
jgi:hypothetical protein